MAKRRTFIVRLELEGNKTSTGNLERSILSKFNNAHAEGRAVFVEAIEECT